MKYAICIPSYKRADRLLHSTGQITLAYVHPSLFDKIYLFVREAEEESYLPVAEKFGIGLITIPNDTDGIRGTRDEILRWAISEELEYCIMIDDDLRLDYKPNARKYIRMIDGEHFNHMIFDLIKYCGSKVPVVGITARQFSDEKVKDFDMDTRIIQVFCLYMPVIKKENIWFSQFSMQFMTDYAFVLTMLQHGYHNLCLNRYCRDDNSQTPGGCSEMRTVEIQNKSAVMLSALFPGIVTPYVKTTGTWKSEPRVNVRVAWRKAYHEQDRNKNLS